MRVLPGRQLDVQWLMCTWIHTALFYTLGLVSGYFRANIPCLLPWDIL